MNIDKLTQRKLLSVAGGLLIGLTSVSAQAGPMAIWSSDGWTAMTLTTAGEDGQVGPGGGGQPFDAEGLYFKQSGSLLSIGLQAGFNLETGYQWNSVSPNDYYAGDLAISFDGTGDSGNASSFEYGVDFGFETRDYDLDLVDMGSGTGIDAAGFYSVSSWNEDVYTNHGAASPFAIDGGSLVSALETNAWSSEVVGGDLSYSRIVTFDIASLGLSGNAGLDVHWTMNCGNDFINGSTTLSSVSEPSIISLMMLSMLMIGWTGRRRKQVA